jgi:hypothetical protein
MLRSQASTFFCTRVDATPITHWSQLGRSPTAILEAKDGAQALARQVTEGAAARKGVDKVPLRQHSRRGELPKLRSACRRLQ